MARLIQRIAERQPQRVALTDHRGSTRWEAFNERVNRLISAFGALGLQPGDTISVFAGNCREYYEVMAAAGHTGVLYVPVNWHFTAEELAYVIDNSESKLLITDQEFAAVATAAPQPFVRIVLHQQRNETNDGIRRDHGRSGVL